MWNNQVKNNLYDSLAQKVDFVVPTGACAHHDLRSSEGFQNLLISVDFFIFTKFIVLVDVWSCTHWTIRIWRLNSSISWVQDQKCQVLEVLRLILDDAVDCSHVEGTAPSWVVLSRVFKFSVAENIIARHKSIIWKIGVVRIWLWKAKSKNKSEESNTQHGWQHDWASENGEEKAFLLSDHFKISLRPFLNCDFLCFQSVLGLDLWCTFFLTVFVTILLRLIFGVISVQNFSIYFRVAILLKWRICTWSTGICSILCRWIHLIWLKY